ncbi:hypothetical protein [Pseudomonas koreensis]|uniref:hypothetical protein n=1 Tax=Pseudomonas koreensis TaxID=198620 RepID=UPI000FDA099A|nr:hypothetical protein [Pseudomonas koreensis]
MTKTARRHGVRFLSIQSEENGMNSNTGVFNNDLAQSLSDRFNATAASFDRTALRIARTLRQSTVSSNWKHSSGR